MQADVGILEEVGQVPLASLQFLLGFQPVRHILGHHAGPDGPNGNAAVQARMLGLINRAQAVGVQLAQQAIGADVLVTVALRLAAVLGLRAVLVRGFLSHET